MSAVWICIVAYRLEELGAIGQLLSVYVHCYNFGGFNAHFNKGLSNDLGLMNGTTVNAGTSEIQERINATVKRIDQYLRNCKPGTIHITPHHIDDPKQPEMCPICYCKLSDVGVIVYPCGHTVHEDCQEVLEHYRHDWRCPVCNAEHAPYFASDKQYDSVQDFIRLLDRL